jgi:dihydromonapterin reductase/dihydrofolate reductase
MSMILITGASQRLGLYLVESFLRSGWSVLAATRSSSDALNQLEMTFSKLIVYQVEKYNQDTGRQLADWVSHMDFTLNAVVNNASLYAKDNEVLAKEDIAFQDFVDIHLMFPESLVRTLYKNVSRTQHSNCSIINITDIYVDNPNEEYALYCASKAGLENLTRSMAKKYAPIFRVNSLKPGPIKFLDEHSEFEKKTVLKQTLIPIESGFEPIFLGVRYLIDNFYVTGSSIYIDGGRSLNR